MEVIFVVVNNHHLFHRLKKVKQSIDCCWSIMPQGLFTSGRKPCIYRTQPTQKSQEISWGSLEGLGCCVACSELKLCPSYAVGRLVRRRKLKKEQTIHSFLVGKSSKFLLGRRDCPVKLRVRGTGTSKDADFMSSLPFWMRIFVVPRYWSHSYSGEKLSPILL